MGEAGIKRSTGSCRLPFVVAAVLYLLALGVVLALVLRWNSGDFAYGLDDSYIHMAVARNVAEHHVWGITRYEWSNASSSPLYTMLLAGVFRIAGARHWIPLALNIVASLCMLFALNSVLSSRAAGMPVWVRAAYLCAFLMVMPLPGLTVMGMEHIFHALVCALLLVAFIQVADDQHKHGRTAALLFVIAGAGTLMRYETLFLVVPMVLGLLYRRRVLMAGGLAVAAAVPVVAFGAVSIAHGGMALPNSLVIKGVLKSPGTESLLELPLVFAERMFNSLLAEPGIAVLTLLMLVYLVRNIRSRASAVWLAGAVALVTATEHFCLVSVGGQYRYSAYIVALYAVAFAPVFAGLVEWALRAEPSLRRRRAAVCMLLVLLATLPFARRAGHGLTGAVKAANNIHDQQCQMGVFLARYCRGEVVAANDIGAINYFADIRNVDFIGLGNNEVTRLRREGEFTAEELHRIFRDRGVTVAVIYDTWLPEPLRPESWIPVCDWRIARNWACGDDTVTFYAANRRRAEKLDRQLRQFAAKLPRSVSVSYYE